MDEQFCIICGVETEWYDSVSTRVMCEDCRRHQLTPVLDYFTSKDRSILLNDKAGLDRSCFH